MKKKKTVRWKIRWDRVEQLRQAVYYYDDYYLKNIFR